MESQSSWILWGEYSERWRISQAGFCGENTQKDGESVKLDFVGRILRKMENQSSWILWGEYSERWRISQAGFYGENNHKGTNCLTT